MSREGLRVQIRHLAIAGAFEVTPQQHTDDRGSFLEWFREDRFLAATGHPLNLSQANCSVSAKGVVRGIHFADVPPGQAKYVTCARGQVFDVAVDLRVGSPTFGRWDAVVLDEVARRAVYLGEGLGHAFMSLADDSTVVYLCSTPYNPRAEHGVHPFDAEIGIEWPGTGADGERVMPALSEKDQAAPTLASCRDAGMLPKADSVDAFLHDLKTASPHAG